MAKFQIPCGRLYDPRTDTSHDVYPCDAWSRWEIVPRDGLRHYACGQHINTVLAELVGKQRTDLTIRDMRED